MFHVDMGNVDPGIVFEYIPETQDVRGFVIIIQFLEYAFAELVDDSYDIDGSHFGVFQG